MQIEIAWKTMDNRQTKTFRDEMDCIAWVRSHSKDIVCINDVCTYGQILNHFDIVNAIRGVSTGLVFSDTRENEGITQSFGTGKTSSFIGAIMKGKTE